MARPKKTQESKEALVSKLDRFMGEIPPADFLILSAGAFAGSQGYTPITMLVKGGGGAVDGLLARIKQGGIEGAAWGFFTAGSPLGGLLASIVAGDAPVEDKAALDQWKATIALACIGMIESYAITRPGAVQAVTTLVGDLAKAGAEAVPF